VNLKRFSFIYFLIYFAIASNAQPANCVFKPPQITIHFGKGYVPDLNSDDLYSYQRVPSSCPTDGHYSFASYTSACFSDDWHTLQEDHTPGDVDGNMLLVNASPYRGTFLRTSIGGLKSNTMYELGLWLMNLCRPTEKCPFPLLPNLNIRLETPEGKVVANIVTGDIARVQEPRWAQHRAYFTTPASTTTLMLVMMDNAPGGCGNDFALDDITFRECVKQIAQVTASPKNNPANTPVKAPVKKSPPIVKPAPKKANPAPPPKKEVQTSQVVKPRADTSSKTISVVKQSQKIFPPPPLVLKTRENALVKRIETEESEIKIELYDNGEIDGDTVSIYHNNTLVKSHARLSDKPISFRISINEEKPLHELVMVAENLGSIPPNTSVMIITAGNKRYEVFISASDQKNAKVVFELKK
jgi:hypothetical protein